MDMPLCQNLGEQMEKQQMTKPDIYKVIIIGAGGHGQVVLDILRNITDCDRYDIIGFLDDNRALEGMTISGVKVLGKTDKLNIIDHDAVFIAVGENKARAEIYRKLKSQSENIISIIHSDAVVSEDVEVGNGVMIGPGVVVNTGSIIKDNVILNTSCSVDHHCQIDDHVHIAPGVHLGGEVIIGEGSLIGVGSSVIPQTNVGKWCIVGAGAVVQNHIEDGVLVAGVPAVKIRELTEEDML